MAEMLSNDMLDLLKDLARHKVEFLIIGGHAVNYYSDPRATKDLDLWIRATPQNAQQVYAALKDFGAPVESRSPADFCDGASFFIIGVKPNRVDLLQNVPGVEFSAAWSRQQRVNLAGVEVGVIGLEDLIRAKTAAGRPQDLADLEKLNKIGKGDKR